MQDPAADILVHRAHHGGVLAAVGADVLGRNSRLVFIETLHRGVLGVEGEIKKEGLIVPVAWFLVARPNKDMGTQKEHRNSYSRRGSH